MAIIPHPSKMEMDPFEIAFNLIKGFEGFRERPYLCPAKKPTIGYGFTNYENGRKVSLYDEPIMKAEAERYLRVKIRELAVEIKPLATVLQECPFALAACIDFCYNIGVSRFKASTLLKSLKNRNIPQAQSEILRWNKANGEILPGLIRRREAEENLLGLCR